MSEQLTTKQRLARLGYTVGERVKVYRRRIIAPDGSDLGPMNVWEANEMLARLESQEVGNE